MSIHKYIFSENIKELESLIKKKFQNGLKSKFGHSNFPFSIKNIKINKFKRINVSAIFDERKIEENREINYGGVNRIRNVDRNDIDSFSFERKNCKIKDLGKEEIYRVEDTDESHTCGTCSGRKEVTCYGCNGSGSNRCGTCNGKREVRCSNCSGRGETNCFGVAGKAQKQKAMVKMKEQKDVILVTEKDLINAQAVPMDTIHVEHVMEMERFLATNVTALER